MPATSGIHVLLFTVPPLPSSSLSCLPSLYFLLPLPSMLTSSPSFNSSPTFLCPSLPSCSPPPFPSLQIYLPSHIISTSFTLIIPTLSSIPSLSPSLAFISIRLHLYSHYPLQLTNPLFSHHFLSFFTSFPLLCFSCVSTPSPTTPALRPSLPPYTVP